jgi:hypothetical protein
LSFVDTIGSLHAHKMTRGPGDGVYDVAELPQIRRSELGSRRRTSMICWR